MLRLASIWRAIASGRVLVLSVYLAAMAGLLALAAHGSSRLTALVFERLPEIQSAPRAAVAPPSPAAAPKPEKPAQSKPKGSVELAQWMWSPRRDYRREYRRERSEWRRRSRGWDWDDDYDDDYEDEYYSYDRDRRRQSSTTYRTLCVRLCDGFYWPISFATTREAFGRDAQKCESSCGAPVRLFAYRNPGGTPEDMVDVKGQPYSRLRTAFLYRTEYDAACKCKPDPWEQASLDRHRLYALEAAKRKGDKTVTQELTALKARVEQEEQSSRTAQAETTQGKLATLPEPAVELERPVVERRERVQAPIDTRERMGLGSRSEERPARPSRPPARIWRDRADIAP